MGISQAEFARRTGISVSHITEIVKGQRAITAETALAFGIFFNMEAQFWVNLQANYDLCKVKMEKEADMRKYIQSIPARSVAEDQTVYSSVKSGHS